MSGANGGWSDEQIAAAMAFEEEELAAESFGPASSSSPFALPFALPCLESQQPSLPLFLQQGLLPGLASQHPALPSLLQLGLLPGLAGQQLALPSMLQQATVPPSSALRLAASAQWLPWFCTCGFRNLATHEVCGGGGPMGCKTPWSSQPGNGLASTQPRVEWMCDCGWRNRAVNEICGGGRDKMGCKAPRPPPGEEVSGDIPIDPSVQELCNYYKIDDNLGRQLTQLLYKRADTSEDDIRRLWNDMENFNNPSALLCMKMKEMRYGTFVGMKLPADDLMGLVKKYKLDEMSSRKLEDLLILRNTRTDDLVQLEKHLELSNAPSKCVMTMLKKLRAGEKLKDPTWEAAPGSYKFRVVQSKTTSKEGEKGGSDRRSRSRQREGRDRDRGDREDRDGNGRRDSDRGRERECERDGQRDANRDDRGRRDSCARRSTSRPDDRRDHDTGSRKDRNPDTVRDRDRGDRDRGDRDDRVSDGWRDSNRADRGDRESDGASQNKDRGNKDGRDRGGGW